MTEFREIKKRSFYDGVEMASFSAVYPFLVIENITAFYQAAAENALEWFISRLFEDEKERYISDPDTSKRFSHKPLRYSLRFDIVYEENDFLCVKNSVALKRGREEISRFCDSQTWSFSDGTMLSPEYALRTIAPSALKIFKKEKPTAVLFEGDSVYILKDSEWIKASR